MPAGRRWPAGRSLPPEMEGGTLGAMSTATWVTMISVLLFVWGGFAAALAVAVRKEGKKLEGE